MCKATRHRLCFHCMDKPCLVVLQGWTSPRSVGILGRDAKSLRLDPWVAVVLNDRRHLLQNPHTYLRLTWRPMVIILSQSNSRINACSLSWTAHPHRREVVFHQTRKNADWSKGFQIQKSCPSNHILACENGERRSVTVLPLFLAEFF